MVSGSRSRSHRRTRGGRARRIVGWSLLGAVALVIAAATWTAADALRVRDQLMEAARVIPTLEDQVIAGDDAALETSIETLQVAASSARQTTGRPHWTLTSWLPGVGANVAAARTLASVVSDLAEGPLPSLPDVAASVNPEVLAPKDGRVDVDAIVRAAPAVVAADDGVDVAIATIGAIDRNGLFAEVDEAVDLLATELSDLKRSTATASRAVQLIPTMMGVEGPREYLVLVQNNAEPRALGGIVGSALVLRVEDGRIDLVEQVAGNSITFDAPIGELSESEVALFGTQMGRYLVNVTSTPEFPRAAQIASAMWEVERGQAPSGVLSIDPVALASLLRSTGPVITQSGVALTADNAAQYLLNQIYLDEPEPDLQDLFFADAAAAIFSALTSGEGDGEAAVRDLVAAADAGRVMLWSGEDSEQDLIAGTSISGESGGSLEHPEVGVYVNDGTGAKAGYYLEVDTSMEVTECRPDGSYRALVSVNLTSTMPDPSTLPDYVTGGGLFVDAGLIRTNVLFVSPVGGVVQSVLAGNGEDELPVLTQQLDENRAAATTVTLAPGETTTLEIEMLTGRGTGAPPSLRLTPGPRDHAQSVNLACAER